MEISWLKKIRGEGAGISLLLRHNCTSESDGAACSLLVWQKDSLQRWNQLLIIFTKFVTFYMRNSSAAGPGPIIVQCLMLETTTLSLPSMWKFFV